MVEEIIDKMLEVSSSIQIVANEMSPSRIEPVVLSAADYKM